MATKIVAVGDIMPGGVLHYIAGNDIYCTKELKDSINGDIVVGTLECAIGDIPHFDPEKMKRNKNIVYALNSDLNRVKELGFNVLALANNHIYDLGEDGLINTIERLNKLGIRHCGAGLNISEASKPAVVEVNGKTFAFISFCCYKENTVGYVPFATDKKSGVNPLYPLSYSTSEVKKYKKLYDYVFVIPHWGIEHQWLPSPDVFDAAKMLINAGADGIIGGHPHIVQPIVKYKNKFIAYSLGNFLFPDRYINKPRPTYYPTLTEDRSEYPITYGYPYVEVPTYKRWKFSGRIGSILYININDSGKINTNVVYTELDTNNITGLASVKAINFISHPLKKVTIFLSLGPLYKTLYKSRIYLGKIKYRILKFLK